MRRSYLKYAPLFLALSGGFHSLSGLNIAGSDLLGEGIQTAIRAQLDSSGVEAKLSFDGSLLGLQAMQDGTADAVIMAVPDSGDPLDMGNVYPFAYQVVAFAVHSTNPVTELTYDQLTKLYEENGVLNDWSDITPDLDWRDRTVSLWVTRSTSSMTLQILNALVLKGSPLKEVVRYAANDSEELQSIVSEDPAALVAVPAISRIPSIQFLAIKEDDAGQAYTPSEDNVFFGDYPLRLPFVLAVSDQVEAADVAKLLSAIYSEEVTAALEAVNYMPVAAAERQSLLSEFE